MNGLPDRVPPATIHRLAPRAGRDPAALVVIALVVYVAISIVAGLR